MALLRYERADTLSAMVLGWVMSSAMIIGAAAVFADLFDSKQRCVSCQRRFG